MTNAFGLYIHVPFCVHKCSYCDFYSFTQYDPEAHFKRYVEQVVNEAKQMKGFLTERGYRKPLRTLFFGGGTPSLFPPELMGEFCETLLDIFAPHSQLEVSMEANPETVDSAYAASLASKTPINRISLGAQSFDPRYLSALERLGSAESIERAVSCFRSAGFDNISLDLITGIAGQTVQEFKLDIDKAMALGPKHLSFYTLTLKPQHPMAPKLPEDEKAADLYESGRLHVESYGFEQYEISNFAQPGWACLHNLLYWDGGDFLGLGTSASSRFFWEGKFHHRKQTNAFEAYLKRQDFVSVPFETTTPEQTILEASFLELRKNEGVDADAFSNRYGLKLREARAFPHLVRGGLIEDEGKRIRLTPKGRLLADSVTSSLADG